MSQLDTDANRSIIRIADTLEDINQKLGYMIKKQTEDYIDSKCRWGM
jgi:hypothetical protein